MVRCRYNRARVHASVTSGLALALEDMDLRAAVKLLWA